MWQLNIPSALQLISHPTRSVALFLLCVCVFVCMVGVMGVPPPPIPEALSPLSHPPTPSFPPTHTAVVVLVQVCVWFVGNLNQMRWCLSACGPITSSISERWRDGGMKRWMDGGKEGRKGGKHCLRKKDKESKS